MKNLFLFLLLFSCSGIAFAQKEIVSYASDLITKDRYTEADRYLDSILKTHPRNVDALMMKGNVLLNREFLKIPDLMLINANSESISDTAEVAPQKGVKILPELTVHAVEKYWKRGLAIDSSRVSLYKGLCTVYAMALMKKELKSEILQLIKKEKNTDGQQAFNIAEYARKFKQRGRFNDAIDIYRFIIHQYPHLPGIVCDLGSEFFYEGRITEAVKCLDSAMQMKNIDESSYLNAAFIYSELGYFDKAYSAFNGYSQTFNTRMNIFYKGLLLFADGNKDYYGMLTAFITTTDSNAYYQEYLLSKDLLAFNDSFTLNNFRYMVRKNHPEWYKPLIYQRAMKDFEKNCEPFVYYGIFQEFIKNYSVAVQLLSDGEGCKMTPIQQEEWTLYYAYALYRNNEKQKSQAFFDPLLKSKDTFKVQAAQFFIGKALLETKHPEEAKKMLTEVANATEHTKYIALSKRLLVQIK